MGLLDQRGIVVTGAGRGLGRAFALAAAEEGAGVVVNDIDAAEAEAVASAIREAGGSAVSSVASVHDWDAASEIVETCVREFGAIDGLINNAVAYSFFGQPWDEEADQVRRQIDVNVIGSIACGVHAMRRMKDRRSGSIVNVTSNAMAGAPGMSTYSITKGALASATYGWALALMPYGVRVNGLAPGALTRAHAMAGTFGKPGKREIPPETVAPAVVWLLSDLSAGITGQVMMLNEGRLGLVQSPKPAEPVLEQEEWTVGEIAEAFDESFRGGLRAIGSRDGDYVWAPLPPDEGTTS